MKLHYTNSLGGSAMLSTKVRKVVATALIFSITGCGSTISFAPQTYEKSVENNSTGVFIDSMTVKQDTPIYFTLDVKNGTIDLDQIGGSKELSTLYRENAKDDKFVHDCVILKAGGGYDSCANRPSASDEDYLSIYHQIDYKVGSALFSNLIVTPICLPFGLLGTIVSVSFKPVASCWPSYSDRTYRDYERAGLVGALVDRRLTKYLNNRLADVRKEEGPDQLEDFYSYYKRHPDADSIVQDIIARHRKIAATTGSSDHYLSAFKYSNSWQDIESAHLVIKSAADKAAIDAVITKLSSVEGDKVKAAIVEFYKKVAARSNRFEDYRKVYEWTDAKADLITAGRAAQSAEDKAYVQAKLNEIEAYEKAAAERAQRAKLLARAQEDVQIRHNFKQGKIGERYVPSFSKSYMSTDAEYYVGSERKEIRSEKSYSVGGYSEAVEGYTLVYALKNNASSNYIVEVLISGTSTQSSYQTVGGGAWSGEKRNQLNKGNSKLSIKKKILLQPGAEFKDQITVGESKPNDLDITIVGVSTVNNAWINGLNKALEDRIDTASAAKHLAPTLEEYAADDRAEPWHEKLKSRKAKADEVIDEADQNEMKRHVTITVDPANNYDPDFVNDVSVHVANSDKRQYDVAITVAGADSMTLSVPARGRSTGVMKIQNVRKSDLKVTALRISR